MRIIGKALKGSGRNARPHLCFFEALDKFYEKRTKGIGVRSGFIPQDQISCSVFQQGARKASRNRRNHLGSRQVTCWALGLEYLPVEKVKEGDNRTDSPDCVCLGSLRPPRMPKIILGDSKSTQGRYDVKMATWLSSVAQYLPSLGTIHCCYDHSMNESSDDPPLIDRIARHLHISVDAHETSLGLNSHSNHNHNPDLPIADPSVQKIDSTDSIGSQPNCQYGSKATLTKEATSVCPPASTKSSTGDGENSASIETVEKGSLILQMCHTVRLIILSSWVNWALLFVPVGITLGVMHRIMGHKSPISPTVKEVRVVQASLLGSILANLLLILGMCFLFGGLRYREQVRGFEVLVTVYVLIGCYQLYNSNITQMSAALLSLSVMSLLLPTAFHASFSNLETADTVVLKVSRGTSVLIGIQLIK
ncbi:predicted protein [Histoplasma mississippiense (nom. inval.)]|uniref:predicted protein n=1 Tax=Ajellomyces capsulatus (strain NAm1 / WU24) TaxID=2059318 RepID=UPI000157C2B4|nr:predicted protein [Histoplasma mississippiense (nom. inval.)]EDN07869.1 predicted protein [Histoplasma mississippiense (nom. inval.)]